VSAWAAASASDESRTLSIAGAGFGRWRERPSKSGRWSPTHILSDSLTVCLSMELCWLLSRVFELSIFMVCSVPRVETYEAYRRFGVELYGAHAENI
jgi:hypothetical protein